MQLPNEWFAGAENTDEGLVIVRGRLHLDAMRNSGQFSSRIEWQWLLHGEADGMPTETEAEAIDRLMNVACDALEKSGTAILTAIYTGARQVRYVFYAVGEEAFAGCLQPLLSRYKSLPIRIGATPDASWSDYIAMIGNQAAATGM